MERVPKPKKATAPVSSNARRASTDSERSLTPSLIQVCVQVGTKQDMYVSRMDKENADEEAEMPRFRTSTSQSCPNLSFKHARNCSRNTVRPSVAQTLYSYRSPSLSAGSSSPLRWSTNFNSQEEHHSPLGQEYAPRRSSDSSVLSGRGIYLVSTCEGLRNSPVPELPLENLISRRDSRKMQDLGIIVNAKSGTQLKVPSPSTFTTSPTMTPLSPVNPKVVFSIGTPSEQQQESKNSSVKTCPSLPQQSLQTKEERLSSLGDQKSLRADDRRCHDIPPVDEKKSLQMNENGTYTLYRTDDHRCSNVIYNANAEHINYSARETTKKCNNQERRCDGILMKQNSENNIKHKQKLPTMSRKRYTRSPDFQDSTSYFRAHTHGSGKSERHHGPDTPFLPRQLSDSYILTTQRTYLFSDDAIGQVIDGLYLGNIKAAYCEPLLCKLNIECVVDLSNLLPAKVPAAVKSMCPCTCPLETAHLRSRLCISIPDDEDIDLTQYATDINRFLDGSLRQGKNVLVYSYHGMSRAPAVVIQFLMMIHSMSFKKAFSLVKTAIPSIAINKGFQKTLKKLQHNLQPADSTDNIVSSFDTTFTVATKARSAWN